MKFELPENLKKILKTGKDFIDRSFNEGVKETYKVLKSHIEDLEEQAEIQRESLRRVLSQRDELIVKEVMANFKDINDPLAEIKNRIKEADKARLRGIL